MGNRIFKTLKIDGVVICEYLGSSDPEEDQQIAQELLRRKRLQSQPSTSRGVFEHAGSFARVANAIYEQDIQSDSASADDAATPFLVNAALSIELFLKTLHVAAGNLEFEHTLLQLHDSLSDSSQRELDAQAGILASLHGEERDISFRDLLTPIDSALDDLRKENEAATTEFINFQRINLAMHTCREVCARAVARDAR
jgi:hypothetical protein